MYEKHFYLVGHGNGMIARADVPPKMWFKLWTWAFEKNVRIVHFRSTLGGLEIIHRRAEGGFSYLASRERRSKRVKKDTECLGQ